ncbi:MULTISPECIES: accessory Sec system protein translocase subunit SecY2 [unclassified Granulicatella]|uniref:accessory Sec system protein translocase subunit SecY2 n=1 Tax=unclassified Granulicatella TaxID=2630493 RepID=UPI0014309737|nr:MULTISPECIES: accessory Sec system protein translocase subunit SecY2 [unclassified Granulicatella]MBF0780163.1 accessory Sec system protein translocase subunit SecY2 [Granulicatella sp. 19428wC4_WM01]
MIKYIRKQLHKYPAVRKSLVTLLILSIYLLGTHISVPGLSKDHIHVNEFLAQVSQLTAGNYNTINLFTLGLGPYMSGMILWRLVTMQKIVDIDKMPEQKINGIRMIVIIIIALIQALNIMLNINSVKINGIPDFIINGVIMLSLISGMCVLMWLCSMNIAYGIGGMSIIILINVLSNLMKQILELLFAKEYIILSIVIFLIILAILLCILMDKGEYRIPLNRVGIDSDYREKTYLPIKVNSSGGLSIMYALTLFALPQYLVYILSYFFKNNNILDWLVRHLNVQTGFGLTIYLVIIFYLTIGFGFFNVNPDDIAEQLQKNGDYIDNVKPGKETRHYLNKLVLHMSIFGATYITILAGAPLLYGLLTQTTSQLYYLPGSVMLITGLTLVVLEEIDVLLIGNKYKTILDDIIEK